MTSLENYLISRETEYWKTSCQNVKQRIQYSKVKR